jgi:cytosine/adenosine deaminase-related metal-dependent hydrolase
MILRARAVLPISAPPIANGAVVISGTRIVAVGGWSKGMRGSSSQVTDLGEVLLMPGLINAHCHLDYTHMAGQFEPPKVFSDWLKDITSTKAGWSLADYTESWRAGAEMLLRTGTTTVADIEAVPQLLPEVWNATPLRVISFLELIGITNRRPPGTVLQEALEKMDSVHHERCRVALSPHAPYSTVPELLKLSARAARRKKTLLCTHVAESSLEFEMFTRGRGAMYDWLQRSGRDMSDCGLGSPVRHLQRCGLMSGRLLVAHANYLASGDAALLAEHGVCVVHCPRSHAYFRHRQFQARRLIGEGVNVCLGTDSLATVHKARGKNLELNMFKEMQALAEREPWLSPRRIVRMATVNGARALGVAGRLGELMAGAQADLIALPFGGKVSRLYDAVLEHEGDIAGSLIDGKWAKPSV